MYDRTIKPRPRGINNNNGLAAMFNNIAGKILQMLETIFTIKIVVLELDEAGLKN